MGVLILIRHIIEAFRVGDGCQGEVAIALLRNGSHLDLAVEDASSSQVVVQVFGETYPRGNPFAVSESFGESVGLAEEGVSLQRVSSCGIPR